MFYIRLSQFAVCSWFCMMVGERAAHAQTSSHFRNAVYPIKYSNNSPTRAKNFLWILHWSYLSMIQGIVWLWHDTCDFANCIILAKEIQNILRRLCLWQTNQRVLQFIFITLLHRITTKENTKSRVRLQLTQRMAQIPILPATWICRSFAII